MVVRRHRQVRPLFRKDNTVFLVTVIQDKHLEDKKIKLYKSNLIWNITFLSAVSLICNCEKGVYKTFYFYCFLYFKTILCIDDRSYMHFFIILMYLQDWFLLYLLIFYSFVLFSCLFQLTLFYNNIKL